MAADAITSVSLLARAGTQRAAGQVEGAADSYRQAADLAAREGDLDNQVEAALGLARCQEYKVTPGSLPVRTARRIFPDDRLFPCPAGECACALLGVRE